MKKFWKDDHIDIIKINAETGDYKRCENYPFEDLKKVFSKFYKEKKQLILFV